MGSQLPLAGEARFAPKLERTPSISRCQLEFVIDDAQLRGMTPAQRQAALRSLAHLLLEASGIATKEAGNDNA